MKVRVFALLCSASVIATAMPAYAQDSQSASDETESVAAVTDEATADEPITVTGSRTIKDGNASPSPVTVVATDDLMKSNPGSTLAEALNALPVFAGSRGATSNPTTSGSAAGGNGGANQLNLRNLDATRTLVLMDGKRVPPTLFNGVVDVDIIPQMLIERVDIVTGGVSAVYGSDAVSGVVNYVVNKKFNGLRAEASYGLTEYGDATKLSAAAAYGTDIGDRGHFEVSYEYRDEGGINRRSDRDWLNQWGVTGLGTTASPYVLSGNLRQSNFSFGGLIRSGALAGQNFTNDGVLSPFVAGTATGTAGVQIGGGGAYWDSGLVAELRGHQMFGRFDYDLTDTVKFYAQVAGNLKTNSNYAETNLLTTVNISRTNAFLSPAIQASIPVAQPTFQLSKYFNNQPRVSTDADSKQWVYMTGLSGSNSGFDWQVDYVHGVSTLDTVMHNVINRQKLGYALDAVSSGGNIVCNVTISNPGLANDCVPLNPFGPTATTAAMMDYVTDDIFYHAVTKMDDVSASVSHSLFDLGAGPAVAALSGEWRTMSISSTSSSRPTDVVNCTGIRFTNCTAGNTLWEYVFGESPTPVSQDVWEVAGEFDMPLISGKTLFQNLSVNGAARYTSYNTSGEYWTWKAGLSWELSDMLRFRVTRSRDIRAPNLYELFSPTSQVTVRATDLLVTGNPSPSVPSIDSSNPNLTAEIANTLTAGVVFKPTSSLSFAVDYYKIDLADAIVQVQGQTAELQRDCYANPTTSPYCALQVRPLGYTDTTAANTVTAWRSLRINLNEIKTWGIDFEANYRGELFGRSMLARVLLAWQPKLEYAQPGAVTIDQGGVGFGPVGLGATPSVRLTGQFRFKPDDNLTVDLIGRWRNAMKLGSSGEWADNHMDAFGTITANLAWDVQSELGGMQFFINVANILNTNPPAGAFSGNGTRAGLRDGFAIGDDPRGRTFTVGAKLKF